MATYLWRVTYTSEGAKGLVSEGGTKRQAAVRQTVEKAGGKLIAFYFAIGEADLYGIAEFPDTVTAAATSLAVNASGAVRLTSTQLLSPEEFDAATKMSISYRAPGA